MIYGICCPVCGKDTNLLIQPYKARGRFSNRTGSLCPKCYKVMKKHKLKPSNRAEFLEIVPVIRGFIKY